MFICNSCSGQTPENSNGEDIQKAKDDKVEVDISNGVRYSFRLHGTEIVASEMVRNINYFLNSFHHEH